MAVSRSPDLEAPPFSTGPGVRHLLTQTLAGRAVLAALAAKLVIAAAGAAIGVLPVAVLTLDTFGSLVLLVALTTLLLQEVARLRYRMLWLVRRKLVLSYFFIGFVPVVLVVAFFALGGLFLFFNFASYLLQTRMTATAYRAQATAFLTALEIGRTGIEQAAGVLDRREAALTNVHPGGSMAVVPMDRSCATDSAFHAGAVVEPVSVGAWSHVEPPDHVPGWIACDGFAGVFAYTSPVAEPSSAQTGREDVALFVRAIAFPDGVAPAFAVVVDLPLNAAARAALRTETGVDVASFTASGGGLRPMIGRGAVDEGDPVDGRSPLSSAAPLTIHDWETGVAGQVIAVVHVSIRGIYDRISAGSTFGSLMLAALVIIGVLFVVIEGAAFLAGLSLARSITGSVHALFEGTERVQKGDFAHRIAGTAPDQLGQLARSFNSMTASIENLLDQQAEQKRLQEELRIAHVIQMSLLPQGPIQMPGLSVSAICVPAREVGGDYYDFFPIDDHRVGILIADVSGKGTSAALYMAELKGLMLSLSRIYTSPRELLVMANRIIRAHLDARSFITIAYAVLDRRSHTMTYARAGHTPLIHLSGRPGGAHARTLTPEGLVLGLSVDDGSMFEQVLQEETIPLESGDLCVFFTDGISEAMNASDDWFGEARLSTLIEDHAGLPMDELRERVLREIAAFVGDAPQHDDMTIILLRVDSLETAQPDAPVLVAEAG